MSDDKPEVEVKIDSLNPDDVAAPLRVDTPFRLIGHGFSKKRSKYTYLPMNMAAIKFQKSKYLLKGILRVQMSF
ncbi:hypothetical protein U8P71_35045 (plasmid) [Rhizobium ruizarguesonis]|nr:hypothetical protein U8P71_35045 [Rhizobium ruizarguesonis]